MKISEQAKKAAEAIDEKVEEWSDQSDTPCGDTERIVQTAINASCAPLVDELERLKDLVGEVDVQIIDALLEAHRKEHGI